MPNHQKHRGKHPDDLYLFSEKFLPALRAAVSDYSWLLSRGYSINSALKITGDRYELTVRQRLALQRAACPDSSLIHRKNAEQEVSALKGRNLAIDGYNLLITLESALSDGFLFKGRDGCLRDISGVHGTYKKVEETMPALQLIGQSLKSLEVAGVKIFLDSPVSNSGRLKALILEESGRMDWNWQVDLVYNPDKALAEAEEIVVSSDSWILDAASRWFNLAAYIVDGLTHARIVDLG